MTGAGSGIGRCMAGRLAELGYRLILAGTRSGEGWKPQPKNSTHQYGLAVRVIPDRPGTTRRSRTRTFSRRVQALGREVDVLVNNAGLSRSATFCKHPSERIERILCLMP
ncbi:MAG: SDR family NAD(P)-dependent oxidoreductase [Alistipes putredinis]